MDKFSTHTGIAAPMRRSSVDTDQIIPAVYLKRVTKTGFDDALFANWRQDPDFLLNQEAYKNASVLIAGPDFGTGSSREHAVWALRDYGFRVVLSPKFADIFRGNAGKQGLLTGIITEADLEALWASIESDPSTPMTVDLETRIAEHGNLRVAFEIDDYTRWRLLEGLDDIGLTLRNEDKIAAYEARRESWRPRTLPVPPLPIQ
ncbi:3-isopropylmalate/(R)-2-methylmalate dehydratase small subunit [Microbacterium endophyticum]|uniref:3-isopropylmalate dehydratase small subunit n=1 Tax=Microbacterium endophyticum TaxID=1526412 RepID=A0A7W4V0K4_9MICO|nr:3-isopropylmalate dehydratase small subunit [Microbacterium endophyticum]MBB2974657.1 3-isopropylmalate/(R)-2-methylmalate dehydratase small subunit [Microbacterium endophyticum]NIK36954.1 3-isopropylmalate/(R)-2-methylmalate dehydratase small subunit [Microbacterium endophyticum]